MPSRIRGPRRADLPLQLEAWRRYRRLTQRDLAKRADVPLNVVTEIETGTRRARMVTLHRLAEVLQTEPWSLYNRPPDLGEIAGRVLCALKALDKAMAAAQTSDLNGAALARVLHASDDEALTNLQDLWTILGNGRLAYLLEAWQSAGQLLAARGEDPGQPPQP
jgi:transcriptional regulator with XRE-family HTH domain